MHQHPRGARQAHGVGRFHRDVRRRYPAAALVAGGLIGPLLRDQADIMNGYRWPVPQRITPGAAIGAAIDRAIAVLVRLWNFDEVFGGSMAMRRAVLDALDLPAILDRAVTEDLPIGSQAGRLGLR